jgi:hypothetical protein
MSLLRGNENKRARALEMAEISHALASFALDRVSPHYRSDGSIPSIP